MPEFRICRVQVDELEKMKGISNIRYTNVSYNILLHSIKNHLWATLCKTLSKFILPTTYPLKLNQASVVGTMIFPSQPHHLDPLDSISSSPSIVTSQLIEPTTFDTVITISGYECGPTLGMDLVMDEGSENIRLQLVIPDSNSYHNFSPSTWRVPLPNLIVLRYIPFPRPLLSLVIVITSMIILSQ